MGIRSLSQLWLAQLCLAQPWLSQPAPGDAPPVGSRVAGKYRVLALLEGGGFDGARVAVESRSSRARRLVVLESLRVEQRQSTGIEAFEAAARVRQGMHHPNVVQTHELVRHGGLPIIVSEYLEGESLATLLAIGFGMPEFSLDVRLTILARALRGLHYIHQQGEAVGRPAGLVHGALSPHQVFVGFDGAVKLGGFGSAAAARGRSIAALAPADLEYLAPEQLQGPSQRASDVFAAGVMLWELVALQRFWNDLPSYEIRRRLLAFDIPDVARLKPSFGGKLGRICRKALAADPRLRYPSATELLIELEQYLADRDAVAPAATIARVMDAACCELRDESRRVLDEAFEALHGGTRRRGVLPGESGFRRVAPREPRARSATALWAAGTLGALLIAVATQATRIKPPARDIAAPDRGDSASLAAEQGEPRALDREAAGALVALPRRLDDPAALDGITGDDGAAGGVAEEASPGESSPLEASAQGTATFIQTLLPEPWADARPAGSPSRASPAKADRGSERRKPDAARLEKREISLDASNEATLTIRLER